MSLTHPANGYLALEGRACVNPHLVGRPDNWGSGGLAAVTILAM